MHVFIATTILLLVLAGPAAAQDGQIWFIFPDRTESDFSGDWATTIRSTERSTAPNQFGRADSRVDSEVAINPDTLADAAADFVQTLSPVLASVSELSGEYMVEQIELNVSITGEGKIGIFTTATVGGEAGIKLILRRRP